MAFWLFKEEPGQDPWDRLVADGETTWDGVANALAQIHLRSARKGDDVLVYLTGKVKAAVGIARVVEGPFPDPAAGDGGLVAVRIRPVKALAAPVTLEAMKGNPRLAGFDLLRLPRLSVVPVREAHWREILAMAGKGSRAARRR